MVILVYQDNVEKDYQTVMAIDWGNFDEEVKERPEDYVFILSPDEMNKFIDLNKQIKAGAEGSVGGVDPQRRRADSSGSELAGV